LTHDHASVLGGRREQQKIAIGDFAQAVGGADRGIEADAWEIGLVAVAQRNAGECLGLIRPDQNVTPGATGCAMPKTSSLSYARFYARSETGARFKP
jgi:hypothetical protein